MIKRPPIKSGEQPITDLKSGQSGMVTRIHATPLQINKLASLGILPGVELKVNQLRPVVIVENDETVLAIERDLACTIIVNPVFERTRNVG